MHLTGNSFSCIGDFRHPRESATPPRMRVDRAGQSMSLDGRASALERSPPALGSIAAASPSTTTPALAFSLLVDATILAAG